MLNIEDGNDRENELNYESIKKIVSIKVYQKDEVRVEPDDIIKDHNDPRFGEAEL